MSEIARRAAEAIKALKGSIAEVKAKSREEEEEEVAGGRGFATDSEEKVV